MGEEQELKTYEVTVTVDYELTVEATSEDEATELAYGLWRSDGDEVFSDVVRVEEI